MDEVFDVVARTFELRHIICHEIASAYDIKADEVDWCFDPRCVRFLRVAVELITETLNPGAPLTQLDMNIAAGVVRDKSLDELQVALRDVRSDYADEAACGPFDDAQAKWQAYCEAWVHVVVGERGGRRLLVADASLQRRGGTHRRTHHPTPGIRAAQRRALGRERHGGSASAPMCFAARALALGRTHRRAERRLRGVSGRQLVRRKFFWPPQPHHDWMRSLMGTLAAS